MSYARIASAVGFGTTPPIDTTGATILFVLMAGDDVGVTDSKSNSWTAISTGSSFVAQWSYCVNPTTGSGHTFSNAHSYNSIGVVAYTGNSATPLDQTNANQASTLQTSLACGSVTPTEDNELILVGMGQGGGGGGATSGFAVDSGFTLVGFVNAAPGSNFGLAMAELIQTSAGTENPTFSWTGSAFEAGEIATFKAAAAPSGSVPLLDRGMSGGFREQTYAGGMLP